MYGYGSGLKASELIEELRALIDEFGDREVYTGGTDYPEGVRGAYVRSSGDGYVPAGAFVVS